MIQPKYTKGNKDLLSDKYHRIGIIGRRSSRVINRVMTYNMALGFVEKGEVIVSGLAHGIDTFAHMGGIERTITVVDNIENPYPKENFALYDDIIWCYNGLAISLNEKPKYDPKRFLERDHLLVDICDEIRVAEMSPIDTHSGTLFTMNYAVKQGKDVYIWRHGGWQDGYEKFGYKVFD